MAGAGDLPAPEPTDEVAPDPVALRRRVLLTGLLSLVLFFLLAFTVSTLGGSDGYVVLGVVLIYLVVVRPLMRPVRAATRLRRRLAYAAFLEGREQEHRG